MQTPRFSGLVPPMVTPLHDRDALDVAGLERLIEHLIAGGVRGLFILGTTGEGPSLGYALRRELIARTCRQVAGRVSVLVGITDTAFVESLAIARAAADAGADAVVAAPPYYLPEGQPELLEWLIDLAPALPLPLMLYNIPSLTKVVIETATIERAMEYPGIVGFKDSSGDLGYFRRLLALQAKRPDWSILMGPEEHLAEAVSAGGHGGVCGGANIFPQLYVALYEAAAVGETAIADELQRMVRRVAGELYGVGQHASRIIKGIKCALSCLDICDDFMASPFRRFRDAERRRIATAVLQLQDEIKTAQAPLIAAN